MRIINNQKVLKLLISPTFLYFAIWSFILYLYSLKIVVFPDLSKGFYFVMTMNIIGLILGTVQAKFTASRYSKNRIIKNIDFFFKLLLDGKTLINNLYKLLILISFIGLIITYLKVFSQVSIMRFFLQQQHVKAQVVRSVLGTYLCMASYIVLPISVCLDFLDNKKVKYSFVPFLFTVLYSLSYWGRFPLLIALCILVTSKILLRILVEEKENSLRFKKSILIKIFFFAIILFLLVFIFMSWTIEIRVAEYGDGYDPYASSYTENKLTKILKSNAYIFGSFKSITMTYSYFVASLPTLSYWAGMESEYGMGQASFPYIYRLFHKIGLINKPVIVGDRVLGSGLQLPSLVGYMYIDFGLIGVFVLSYLLGVVGTNTFNNFLIKPNLSRLMYLTSIYLIILFSPFTSVFSQTIFVIILFGYFLVNSYLEWKFKF